MTEIEKLLQTHGPLLSGELAELMNPEGKLSKDAIRKRISRAGKPVMKLRGFFADNQSFMYLQQQYKSEEYFLGLRYAFKKAAKRLYAAIAAIEFHNGYITENAISAYLFSPIKNLQGHKLSKKILYELNTLGILLYEEPHYQLHPYISENDTGIFTKFKAIETTKGFVLAQFSSWIRTIGLSSYNTAQYYSEFAKFQWAFTSPSYVKSLTAYKAEKIIPAFVVADILLGKEATEEDVQFFVEKINIVTAQKNNSRILPFLIVETVTPKALKLLKENGVIVAFVNTIFGKEYQKLLQALITTLTNAGAILKKNPEDYLNLIAKINKLVEGKTNNLRGDLFELAVGFYHGQKCNSLDIGKIVRREGSYKEIDVFATYHEKVVVAECKGYKQRLSLSDIKDWIEDKIPFFKHWIAEQSPYDKKAIVFELWSTGGFSEDAIEFLEYISSKTKKYQILFFDESDIKSKAKETGSRKFSDILNQYYFGDSL